MTATPSQALRALSTVPSREQRQAAATALLSGFTDIARATTSARERLAEVLEEAWRGIPTPRAEVVAGLVETIRTDPTHTTIEAAAGALALEGEDGVTELLALTTHPEFAVRKRVVGALSILGRSARWAVPTLIRFLYREPLDYVRCEVIAALGRIGGREAIARLEELRWAAQGSGRWEQAAEISDALVRARAMNLPRDQAGTTAEAAEEWAGDASADAEDSDEDDEWAEDPWGAVSGAELAEAIDGALIEDNNESPSGEVFGPVRRVSLRSVLLGALPGDKDTQLRAGEWLDDNGIEETFFRVARTSPKRVVCCSVSSSMVSGSWGVCEFRLRDRGHLYYSPDEGEHESILGAWEPADDAAARRACILSTYVREWHERVLPPAMGEWATGDPKLLRDAILHVLEAERLAWKEILNRLEDAPEPREASAETVAEVATASAAAAESVRDLLPQVAARDKELERRLLAGESSDEERRALVALFVQCIAKDPAAGP